MDGGRDPRQWLIFFFAVLSEIGSGINFNLRGINGITEGMTL